ncbi:MAG: phosphotransferase family protein [Thermomicrobiales bacterium]
METAQPESSGNRGTGIQSAQEAADFLSTNFDPGIGEVSGLGAGAWSTAYAFQSGGKNLVARFGFHLEDFERDQVAARFATPDLPIPAVVQIKEAAGGYCAISERAFGGFLDDLDGTQMRAMLPFLFAALDATRCADLSGTTGYGNWNVEEHAPFQSWRDVLLSVSSDPPEHRGYGWRQRLATSPVGSGMFDEALATMEVLADQVPNERHLIHSDLLNFNVLVANDRLSGVIDWGCSLYGDFLYDIAWFAFYAPWYPAWKGIDFLAEAQRHYAGIGLDVPGFADRLRCYQIHIGLGDQSYNSTLGKWDKVIQSGRRTLSIARGEDRG